MFSRARKCVGLRKGKRACTTWKYTSTRSSANLRKGGMRNMGEFSSRDGEKTEGCALRRGRSARNIHTLCENVRPEAYMQVHPNPSTGLDGMQATGTRPDR